MELALVIWAITSLNAISGFFAVITVIACFVAFCTLMFPLVAELPEDQSDAFWLSSKKILRCCIITALVTGFIGAVLPTTKTGWMMAGGYVAQTAIQSDTAKKFALVIENKMQEVLDEAAEQAKIKAKSINKETEKKE